MGADGGGNRGRLFSKQKKEQKCWVWVYLIQHATENRKYTQTLLEKATGVVAESVFKEDGKIDECTWAWARKCGGIPLQSRQGKGCTYNCKNIRRSQGKAPVTVKSPSPVDVGSATGEDLSIVEQLRIEKRKATCFLRIVRNPSDVYAAELRFLSKDVQIFQKAWEQLGIFLQKLR